MPRVPTIQRSVQESGGTQPVRVSGQTSSVQTKQVGTKLSFEVASHLDRQAKVMQEEEEKLHKAVMGEHEVKVQALEQRILQDVTKNYLGKSAAQASEWANQELLKGLKDLRKEGIHTPRQAEDADRLENARMERLNARINQHTSKEMHKWEVETAGTALANSQATAAQVYGDEQFEEVMKDVEAKVDTAARASGIDRDALASESRRLATEHYITSQLQNGQTDEALRMLNAQRKKMSTADAKQLQDKWTDLIKDRAQDVQSSKIADEAFQKNNMNEGDPKAKTEAQVIKDILSDTSMPLELRQEAVKKYQQLTTDKRQGEAATDLALTDRIMNSDAGKRGDYIAEINARPHLYKDLSGAQRDKLKKASRSYKIREMSRNSRLNANIQRNIALEVRRNTQEFLEKGGGNALQARIMDINADTPPDELLAIQAELNNIPNKDAELFLRREFDRNRKHKASSGAGSDPGSLKSARLTTKAVVSTVKGLLDAADPEGEGINKPIYTEGSKTEQNQRNRAHKKMVMDQAEAAAAQRIAEYNRSEAGQKNPISTDSALDPNDTRAQRILMHEYAALYKERAPGLPEWRARIEDVDTLAQQKVDVDDVAGRRSFHNLKSAVTQLYGKDKADDEDFMGNLYATYQLTVGPETLARMDGTKVKDPLTGKERDPLAGDLTFKTITGPLQMVLHNEGSGVTMEMLEELMETNLDTAGGAVGPVFMSDDLRRRIQRRELEEAETAAKKQQHTDSFKTRDFPAL